MPNATLERFRSERQHQIEFIDELTARVEADGGRDLVDAEVANLQAARDRISELTEQIAPLEEFEALRTQHMNALPASGGAPQPGGRQLSGRPEFEYHDVGHFMVDLIRARGFMGERGQRSQGDPEAQRRIEYAVANQTTTQLAGILPEPVVGAVVNLIDASRPFITSIGGARAMGGIPGKTFSRPKITQRTKVGLQSAEKAELPSQQLIIGDIPFNKLTKGGALDVSRQSIDWTSPAAWDILIRDLADQYAIETENEAADAFAAGAAGTNAAVAVDAAGDLDAWSAALYGAASKVYASSKRLPNMIWVSTDQWASLGPLFDNACCNTTAPGSSAIDSFTGNMWRIPRIVVPSFPASTVIVGWTGAFEVYEEVIGLLTAVEPSLLGVEIAYGGYIAFNYVADEGVCPITPPVAVP